MHLLRILKNVQHFATYKDQQELFLILLLSKLKEKNERPLIIATENNFFEIKLTNWEEFLNNYVQEGGLKNKIK